MMEVRSQDQKLANARSGGEILVQLKFNTILSGSAGDNELFIPRLRCPELKKFRF